MLNPRRLILKLLLAADDGRLSTREAVAAGELLGFSENSMRVALARLTAQQRLAASERGRYGLGPAATGLAEEVRGWRAGEARVRDWDGGWLAVHTGALGRSDRSALRLRERALDLLGLRPLLPGLYLRPDNLQGGVAAARTRLRGLGLPAEALVARLDQLDDPSQARAARLWDSAALNRRYRQQRERLEAWMARAPQLDPEVAAREAFALGDEAIRALVFDPLLPAPLVDVAARAAFTDTVRRFDRVGHGYWQRLALALSVPVPVPVATPAPAAGLRPH